MVPVFKNVGERSTAKNYCPVSLLSVVSKVFEKLVIVIIFKNFIIFFLICSKVLGLLDLGFRSSDLLTVVSDRITRVFNRSGATRAVSLDISKGF